MRSLIPNAAQAIVWLIAALLPVQAVFPATCDLERPYQLVGQNRFATVLAGPDHSGDYCGGRAARCSTDPSTAGRDASGCEVVPCSCDSSETPAASPTGSDNSPSVKQVLHPSNLATVSLFVDGPRLDRSLSLGGTATSPATSLERLSTLCRFLI